MANHAADGRYTRAPTNGVPPRRHRITGSEVLARQALGFALDSAVRLVILGPPGAGKGTQSSGLALDLRVPHISTGDLLREQATADTELGSQVRWIIERGDLVPDDLVLRTLECRLAEPDVVRRGFLLDGFPRTVEQARALATLVAPTTIDMVIALAVGPDTVARRLALRGRADDTRSAVRVRLERYYRDTVPVLAWYEQAGLLWPVDGDRPADHVREEVCSRIDALGLSRRDLAARAPQR